MTGKGELSFDATVPALYIQHNNAKFIGIYLRICNIANCATVDNTVVKFSKIELINIADADLIVDGVITAEKIVAKITAEKSLPLFC